MDGACCAHLCVYWTEQRRERGETCGWWECRDCRQKFVPMPVVRPRLEPTTGTLGANVIAGT